MNARALLSPVIGVALIGAVACGASASAQSSTSASSQRARASAAWHTFVVCLRQHGYPNAPDPVFDSGGNAGFPTTTNTADLPGKNQIPAACQQAAASLAQRGSGHSGPPAADRPSAADRRLGRQLAQCMRLHGVPDWPDPNPDGSWSLPPRLQGKTPWIGAMQHCKQYLPSGHLYGP
jgi:hypothetical protein